jgi:hypothetical protein
VSRFVCRLLVRVLPLLVAAGAAGAGTLEAPDGIPVGPWILKPLFDLGYSRDSNVFYAPPGGDLEADDVMTAAAALSAKLPFRNSLFTADYHAVRTDYRTISVPRKLARDFGLGLELKFSTMDRLDLTAHETYGTADTKLFDPGGATVYQGVPYYYSTQQIEAAREEYGHRGYVVRLTGNRQDFDSTELAFFEYTGYEGFLEYREPLSSRLWLVASYEGRRYDDFLANQRSPNGAPAWRERSELYWVGVRGLLGPEEPYVLRAGWARFRFPGTAGSASGDLTLEGSLQLHLGGSTGLHVLASRRPWPTYFTFEGEQVNKYVVESLLARVERRWLDFSTVGVEASFGHYRFDRLPGGSQRKDKATGAKVYANLMIRERIGFRVSIEQGRRTSDHEFAVYEYRKTVYWVGLVLGWLD